MIRLGRFRHRKGGVRGDEEERGGLIVGIAVESKIKDYRRIDSHNAPAIYHAGIGLESRTGVDVTPRALAG